MKSGSAQHKKSCSRVLSLIGTALMLALGTSFEVRAATPTTSTPSQSPEAPSKISEHRRVVVLGDSLTAGYGLDISESYPSLLQKKVEAAGFPYQIINAGVSGDTTSGGLRRMDWILRQPIDVLIISLGGNDGLRGISLEVTRSNLTAMVAKLHQKQPRAGVIIAGMQMPPNMGAEYTGHFKRLFEEVAKETQSGLVPFLLEGVGGKVEFNQPDLIHPTAEGQKVLAENVWKVLEPTLKQRSAQP